MESNVYFVNHELNVTIIFYWIYTAQAKHPQVPAAITKSKSATMMIAEENTNVEK